MLRKFSTKGDSISILLLCASIAAGTALGRAQTAVPPAGPGVCAEKVCSDGTRVACNVDCRAYLCQTGWAQAHGYGSACGQGSSAATSPALTPMQQVLVGAVGQLASGLGQMLADALFGGLKSNNTTTPAAGAPDADQQRMVELQREQQREAERLAKFRQEMRQLQLAMKGPKLPDESLLFKDSGDCFLQTNCHPRVLEFKPINPGSAQRAFSNPFDQLRISTCLSKMAAEATDPDNASYLSEEAAKAMQGAIVDVDVSGCSSGPGPARAPLAPEQTTLYKSLLDSTNQQMDQLVQLQQQKVKLEADKTQLKQQIQTQQQLVAQLNQQPAPDPATQAEPQTPKPNAAADAEAALQASQQALADEEKTEAQVDNEMKQVGDKLKDIQSRFDQVQADPSKAGALTQSSPQ